MGLSTFPEVKCSFPYVLNPFSHSARVYGHKTVHNATTAINIDKQNTLFKGSLKFS